MEQSELITQLPIPVVEAIKLIDDLEKQDLVRRLGQSLLVSSISWNRLSAEIMKITEEYHSKFHVRSGIPKVELANRARLGKSSQLVMERLAAEGVLVDEGMTMRLSEFTVKLTAVQQQKVDSFLKSLEDNPYSPSTELIPEPDLLVLLVDQGKVVKLSDAVVIAKNTFDQMLNRVLSQLNTKGKVTLAEVRDMFQTSRKYAQAFLEYLDGEKITRRVGDERVKY
jgi:selenocysteine-specific elongation factor